MNVLIVEDNIADQRVLAEAFKRGYPGSRPVFADDVDKAFAILHAAIGKKDLPQFILLDLNLPKKSGKDFLVEIKSDKLLSEIPVIIFTSSDAFSDVTECYELGASCYLKKPMRFSEIQSLITSICAFWFRQSSFFKNQFMQSNSEIKRGKIYA